MNSLFKTAKKHLQYLCETISERHLGSQGNKQATGYFKKVLQQNRWETEESLLEVMDWKTKGATLHCGMQSFEVFSSPYSLGCNNEGELTAIDSVSKLQHTDLQGKIVLLHGKIAAEQIMPKNFVFYNPEHHQQIIQLLERSGVKAIICATGKNPSLAGGVYPFPMFEDGDFDIPSVFMKDTEGEKLLTCVGQQIKLESQATRIPGTAFNVIGQKPGREKQRIVITAHIDAKQGTPGALDNATGVTVLLLLSEILKNSHLQHPVELVAFNGEDYYAASGQMKYIEQQKNGFHDILLNINIDGVGYMEGTSAFSALGLPHAIQDAFHTIINKHPNIVEGTPWYQGDHGIFLQYGRPAIAVTSEWFIQNMETQNITHTERDNLSIIDHRKVVESAMAIHELLLHGF
jgi:aminopeptidase YwaD